LIGDSPDLSWQLSDKDSNKDAGNVFDYVHRRTASADIYFVRNTLDESTKAAFSFRVSDRAPELWMPDNGTTSAVLVYRETQNGRTEIPLSIPARGSVFLLFERPLAAHLNEIEKDGSEVYPSAHRGVGLFAGEGTALVAAEAGIYRVRDSEGKSRTISIPGDQSDAPAFGPWTLSFPSGWGAPTSIPVEEFESWTASQDPGVKYFSGTAIYHTTVHVSGAIARQEQVWLNLGDVREIATVKVNGADVETMWRAPFVTRIDRQLHAGDNALEIEVSNLWPNRIIGDLQPSSTVQHTHTNVRAYTKDSPLLPSGILEPVTLMVERAEPLR
jgi:hypothetical protein